MSWLTPRKKAIKEASKLSRLFLALNFANGNDNNKGDNIRSESSNSTLEDLFLAAYTRLNSLQDSRYFEQHLYCPLYC